jgi:hypothetical protein
VVWSDEDGGLLEGQGVGARVGVPSKKELAPSQGSEGDLLSPRALS